MQQDKYRRNDSEENKEKRHEAYRRFCEWYSQEAMERIEDDEDYGSDDADCNLLNCC